LARTPEPNASQAGGADLTRILSSATGFWSSRTPFERRRYITWGVALLLVVSVATYFLTRNPYTLVFYNLNAADAGQVTQQLTSLKIPYQLQGTSIYVPASMADQARIDLATQGLPAQGSVGYSSVLQSSGLGETSQQFSLATLNALQADLSTTIEAISGVQKATVYIYQAQPSVFVDQSTAQATASVFVDLLPGVKLSPEQVLGIQELVAHAVGGLKASNVSVADQTGNALASAGSSDPTSSGGGNSEIGLQQSFQTKLNNQIAALLTPIVGPGNVIVQTNATLDLTQTSSQSTIVQPLPSGLGVPVSNHTIKETFTGTGTPPAVTGSSSSVPTYPTTTGGTNTLNYTESTINYDVTKVNQTVTSQPFTIKGLTVSVTLNSRAYHLTAANSKAIEKLIATAVGYTNAAKAASDITIFSAPFAKTPAPNFNNSQSALPSTPVLAGGAAGALMIFFLIFMLLRRRKRPAVQVQRLQPPPQQHVPPPPAGSADPGRQALERTRNLVMEDPEEAAQLVRGWLKEDTPNRRR
jgi:flagellar M-ring protein FliF